MTNSSSQSAQGQLLSVGARVKALVATHFGIRGVNKAAATWGIPQPTLRRVIEGITKHPRADLLSRITAAHPNVTLEWLLDGSGPNPLEHTDVPKSLAGARAEFPERAEWHRIARELELSNETRDALEGVLRSPFLVLGLLVDWQTDQSLDDSFIAADRASHRAWVNVLRGAVDTVGPETVRAKIESMSLWLRLGPTASGLAVLASTAGPEVKELLLNQAAADRIEVAAYEKHHPEDRGLARTARILSVAAKSEALALSTPSRIRRAMTRSGKKDGEVATPQGKGRQPRGRRR
jgi:hypothetical protein